MVTLSWMNAKILVIVRKLFNYYELNNESNINVSRVELIKPSSEPFHPDAFYWLHDNFYNFHMYGNNYKKYIIS